MPEPPGEAVVLDTDVASRSFRERLPPPLAARLVGNQPILTFVTVGELAQWTKLRHWGWGPRNLAMLDSWLADKPVIPGSRAIAALWGRPVSGGHPARAAWPGQRHLGCCLLPDLPAAARHLNLKDFKDFAEHHGLRLLDL